MVLSSSASQTKATQREAGAGPGATASSKCSTVMEYLSVDVGHYFGLLSWSRLACNLTN